jgi:hypothetical protein
MPTEIINVFPMIHSITIDKEKALITELVQDIVDEQGVLDNLAESVATVRQYQKKGFYPLIEPQFIDDVMGSFAQMGLSRHITISDNTYHEINGYLGCTRVWELPLLLRDQVEKALVGYEVEYDVDTWEILNIRDTQV